MVNLIPLPNEYKALDGYCKISTDSKISSQIDLPLVESKLDDNGEIKVIKDDSLQKEQYTLDVSKNGITIKASCNIGAYYALQSLRQLSKVELGSNKVACCSIKDEPRYRWRGLQLDVSRHFFSKDEIKRLLDMMHMMKLNVFHWHLTDDQGWRIEIKKYPLLTEIGSVRNCTQINGWRSTDIVQGEHSGYYTQEDIKEIVEYAANRGISIVPEIDFPAHCAAAIAAYPWLACREIDCEVPGYFGGIIPEKIYNIKDWNRPICLGNDRVIEFVKDIIDEVCELFPMPYYHIGGDETDKREWSKCPKCQRRIEEHNLGNTDNLQGWFNNELLAYLKSKGKSIIGWNDILSAGNLDDSIVVQYWTPQRDKKAEAYAKNGGRMILSNHQSFYFDMTYAQYPLKNTYNYKPERFRIAPSDNILGVEGELWTEWIDGKEKLELNTYPRMQALADNAWSSGEKNLHDFYARLEDFKPFFEYFGIGYAVDKVARASNPVLRIINNKKFYVGDTHAEVKLNNKLKSQGEK